MQARLWYLGEELSTGIPRFFGICFLLAFFYELNVCGNPGLSGLSAPFFQQHLSHVGSSNTFSLLWYLLRWPMISDRWCYFHSCFGDPQSLPYKMTKLTDRVCARSDCSLSSGLTWSTATLKLGQLITLKWPLSVHMKGRVRCLSL